MEDSFITAICVLVFLLSFTLPSPALMFAGASISPLSAFYSSWKRIKVNIYSNQQ